ncbi:MAG TPA: tetratricopeptide repeat protein [Thermoanaerobaculia bacterium]|nr:tetratricopeptide repeat protein [Thermoanaerobaculia bacterium]
MRRSLVLAVLALLLLPLLALTSGCERLQARVELKKGNSLYQQEQYSAALVEYQKGLQLDPADTFAWRSVGLSALALYRPGDDSPKNIEYARIATDAFEKYLKESPEDAKVQDYMMSILVSSKQYEKALAFVDTLQQEHPAEANDPKWNKYRVNVLIQAGRLEDAEKLALQTPGPEQPVSLYSIGVAAWNKVYNNNTIDFATRQQKVEMGLASLHKAVDLKPDYFDAMFYLGLMLREKAKLETDANARTTDVNDAEVWLKKGLELRKKAQPAAPTATAQSK